jgi:hypothetical protein
MFATLFDRGYLLRGLAMIHSLLAESPSAEITVLALDWETHAFLSKDFQNQRVHILTLDDLNSDPLWEARRTRSYRDFCWTLSSVICHHLLREYDEVVYLDADICFFDNPDLLLDSCRNGQVAAVPHGFPDRLRSLEENGIFNVEWVYFAGAEGRVASQHWAAQCLHRCELAPEEGIVGDQKYLDEWPQLYKSFVSLDHQGAGVAPWNHEVRNPRRLDGRWIVGTGTNMIFYHFHGLSISSTGYVTLSGPTYSEVQAMPEDLYREYLGRLGANWERVRHLVPEPEPSMWHLRPHRFRSIRRLLRRIH